jgi:hypothetical protein
MKIYTFYSESHMDLYKIFMESVSKTNPNLEIETDTVPQEGSGIFMEEGWERTMTKKMDQIIRASKSEEIFIHSDSDVIFFKNIESEILEELGDYDLAFQDDGDAGLCMGFFVCKPSPQITKLFEAVRSSISSFNGHDQNALNHLINSHPIRYKKLSSAFFSYGQLRRGVWGGEEFQVDPKIRVLHANWVIGIDKKIDIIKYVSSNIF